MMEWRVFIVTISFLLGLVIGSLLPLHLQHHDIEHIVERICNVLD